MYTDVCSLFTPTMAPPYLGVQNQRILWTKVFFREMPSLTLPTTEEKGIEHRNATFQIYSTSRVLRGLNWIWKFEHSWSLEIYPKLTLLKNDLAGQTADFLLSTRTCSLCFFRCVFIAWLWLISSLVSDFFKGIVPWTNWDNTPFVLVGSVSVWQIPSHFMHAQSMVIDWLIHCHLSINNYNFNHP